MLKTRSFTIPVHRDTCRGLLMQYSQHVCYYRSKLTFFLICFQIVKVPRYLIMHKCLQVIWDFETFIIHVSQRLFMNFTVAGLPADKMVEAHGTFSDATCLICRQRHDKEDIKVIQLYSVTRSWIFFIFSVIVRLLSVLNIWIS